MADRDGEIVAWRWRYLPIDGFPMGRWNYQETALKRHHEETVEVQALTVLTDSTEAAAP